MLSGVVSKGMMSREKISKGIDVEGMRTMMMAIETKGVGVRLSSGQEVRKICVLRIDESERRSLHPVQPPSPSIHTSAGLAAPFTTRRRDIRIPTIENGRPRPLQRMTYTHSFQRLTPVFPSHHSPSVGSSGELLCHPSFHIQ